MKLTVRTLVSLFLLLSFSLSAENNTERFWKPVSSESLNAMPKVRRNSSPSVAHYYQLNLAELKSALQNAPVRGEFNGQSQLIMSFPMANGNFEKFRVMESPIMHPVLAAKYPMIKTYCAQGIDDPTATMRFSVTQFGLHTFTLSGRTSTNYMDPYTEDRLNYIVYNKESLGGPTDDFKCFTLEVEHLPSGRNGVAGVANNTDDQMLRTFRLALSCNAEYGNIFATTPGSEVADIMAQMTISMNRVNGVYERDLAITMQFIPNNDLLIFYGNTGTDPWNGEYNNTTAQTIDALIGVPNYDIGHNFNTSGGGNAGCIACVCEVNGSQHKGSGYTGSSNPTGDAFDIDYVAHEMGHQFGGYHTMNTCSRSGSGTTEVEPASASSIMGYAGICPTDVQPHSDDDFTWVNVRDISENVQTGTGTCAAITNLTNQPPTADAGNDYVIPKGTAYILEGTATDPDGLASLTYNWCQNDPEQSPGNAAPQPTYTVGPLYRAIRPQPSPNRYMPNLRSVILNNLVPTWEVTPSVARDMSFSFIVRDNDVSGGQTASDLMNVTVDNAGPFVVTSQNTATTWNAGSSVTVTWNVAGTNAGNVNTPNVNIYLSLDSGYTYPYTLAANAPNNGSASVTVPAGATTTKGRVMVRGAGNIFYALNSAYITVQASEFVMNVSNASQNLCPPIDADYNFNYNTFLGFNETTTFSAAGNPAGTTVTFNPATAVTDGTPVLMTVSGLTAAMAGTYTVTITGTSATVTKSTDVTLNILEPSPAAAVLATPANAATGINAPATLTWNAVTGPNMLYDIEIATDAAFANIVSSATGLSNTSFIATGLASSTVYYWRVRAYTSCGSAPQSSVYSFTTSSCSANVSANVPVLISGTGTPTVTSTLTIALSGTINKVTVTGLVGVHTYMGDLTFTLTSPQNTTITLFGGICGSDENFDVNFDDAAPAGALPCPPIGGGTYQPQNALSAFNGQNPNGVWTLTVADGANIDGGSLNGWGLGICTNGPTGITTQSLSNLISIYPNPANENVTISCSGAANELYAVKIANNLGQLILETTVNANTKRTIDLKDFDAGVYFVTVGGNEKTETRKIIVTK